MSTRIDGSTISPEFGPDQQPAERYRALSTSAIASLVFGVLSVLVLFGWYYAFIPAAGIASGWFARLRIRENPEEMTGLVLAWTGLGLSAAFWALGYGGLLLARIREVPFGYERVEYGDLQPDPKVPGEQIPPSAFWFQDRKIFVKGYMAPTRQQTRLKRFVLCPAIPDCPFCPANPKPTEKILVTLSGDLEAEYTVHEVRVGGTLKIDPEARIGIPYSMEADYLR